jgi:hypothetical protein
MSRILNFKEYLLNEGESFDGYQDFLELPEKIKKYLKNSTSKNKFAKALGPDFSIRLEGDRLHFINGDKNVEFPFIIFTDGDIIADQETIGDPANYKKFEVDLLGPDKEVYSKFSIERIMDKLARRTRDYSPEYTQSIETIIGRYIGDIIDNIYTERAKKKEGFLNPFDTNLEENKSMRILNDMGVRIVSTDRQKKTGTLQLTAPFLSGDIAIYPNGYIRRIAGGVSPMTSNVQLTRPILNEDDLNLKLTYAIIYCIKTILKDSGVSNKKITEIGKSFLEGDFKDYNELILSIANNDPTTAHILPDPNNVIPEVLKRGAGILSRFGNLFNL